LQQQIVIKYEIICPSFFAATKYMEHYHLPGLAVVSRQWAVGSLCFQAKQQTPTALTRMQLVKLYPFFLFF
jgi:hypothetical protein